MSEVFNKKLQGVPGGFYMNKEQQLFFRRALEAETLEVHARIGERRATLASPEREPDENDLASAVESRSLILLMLDHDSARLKEINAAIKAMDDGDYGYYAHSGEEIGIERLLRNPAALLSFESKQLFETAARHQVA